MKFFRIIVGCIGVLLAMGVTGCGAKEVAKAEVVEKKKASADDIAREFFTDWELVYDSDYLSDSVSVYTAYFEDGVRVRVVVSMEEGYYLIEGGNAELLIPKEDVDIALEAINYNNIHEPLSYGAIYDDGRVVFRISRNFEGGAYSKEAFAEDYVMVLKNVKEKIPSIYDMARKGTRPAQADMSVHDKI